MREYTARVSGTFYNQPQYIDQLNLNALPGTGNQEQVFKINLAMER